MGATNKEMKIILSHLPHIIREHLPGYQLLRYFFKDQRKNYGPRFNIYLSNKEGKHLFIQPIAIVKTLYNFSTMGATSKNLFSEPKSFYTRFFLLKELKDIKDSLEIPANYSKVSLGTVREAMDTMPISHTLDSTGVDELKFIADFFRVPLIDEEKELRKKYGPIVCKQCGNCCRYYLKVHIEKSDIERWEREGRRDIIKHLFTYCKLYYLPITEYKLKHCPFLVDNSCSIHDTKPASCKEWPHSFKCLEDVQCGGISKAETCKS